MASTRDQCNHFDRRGRSNASSSQVSEIAERLHAKGPANQSPNSIVDYSLDRLVDWLLGRPRLLHARPALAPCQPVDGDADGDIADSESAKYFKNVSH